MNDVQIVQPAPVPAPGTMEAIWMRILWGVEHAKAPAGLAIITAVGSQMVIAAFDARVSAWLQSRGHAWARPLNRGEEWALSWALTAFIAFPIWCLIMAVDVRDNFALGFIAGFGSPLITGGFRKAGFDIEAFILRGGRDENGGTPPPAGGV